MPQKRKSMKQIRKIFSMKLNDETISIRTIACAAKVSRPVVKNYLDYLEKTPLTIDELNKMNDADLKEHLGITAQPVYETEENKKLKQWLEKHIFMLSRIGMTRRLLHEKYLLEHPAGLMYSQFCFVLKYHFQTPEASALFEHKAGDKMYIDFTGKKLNWRDTHGKEYSEEIFISVLGASSYLYSLPVPSQKQEDLVHAVEQAFLFYGGVPKAVVPDCLKSAVLGYYGHEYNPNPLFQRLMEHYGSFCIPARPKRPKDKPLVEGAVNLIYRQILARMDNNVFENRLAMLKWWTDSIKRVNLLPFQKLPGTRQSRFESTDKPELKALPSERFELTSILSQTVASTGVIYVPQDKTSYSVPASLQGKKVEVMLSSMSMEIWHEGERYAVHDRSPGAGKIISPTHRPKAQQWYADRNSGKLLLSFKSFGPHIYSWASHICDTAGHEDQAWMMLIGLEKLRTKYLNRLDTVCRIAIRKELYTLKSLKKILKGDEDLALIECEKLNLELPLHENVRGADYYRTSGLLV